MKLLQKARDEGRVGGTFPFHIREMYPCSLGHEAATESPGRGQGKRNFSIPHKGNVFVKFGQ